MQYRKKGTLEPSNEAISPFPACCSIPREKAQFREYYDVISKTEKRTKDINEDSNW